MEKKVPLIPEKTGLYLLNILLAGARTGIYRFLFLFYVRDLGYEEGLINVLITASVMVAVVSILPLSYIVDWVGKRRSLTVGIAGMVLSLLFMFIFPSRAMFLTMNMLLGFCQALTQASTGPEQTRYLTVMQRMFYYSIPVAVATFSNYAIGFFPWGLDIEVDPLGDAGIFYLVGAAVIALFSFMDSRYLSETQKKSALRFNIGGVEISLNTLMNDEDAEEEFIPFPSVALQVNFILQGVLQGQNYQGPSIEIGENIAGDLVVIVESQGEYIGIDEIPEGKVKTLVQQARDIWVEQNLRKKSE